MLARELNAFLQELPVEKRVIFLRRYFYSKPLGDIARELGISEAKVKVVLHRLREQLQKRLEVTGLL